MSKSAMTQPTITVDQRGMLIPLDTLDVAGTGIAVIALARGAYLIVRPDLLAAFSPHYLRELSRKVQALDSAEEKIIAERDARFRDAEPSRFLDLP
jgi:hypothetical protein